MTCRARKSTAVRLTRGTHVACLLAVLSAGIASPALSSGLTWRLVGQFPNDLSPGYTHRFVVKPSGGACVLYRNSSGLVYRDMDDASTGIGQPELVSANSTAAFSDLGIDHDGVAHVVFSPDGTSYFYASRSNGTWASEPISRGGALFFDSSNFPHLLSGSGVLCPRASQGIQLHHLYRDAASWHDTASPFYSGQFVEAGPALQGTDCVAVLGTYSSGGCLCPGDPGCLVADERLAAELQPTSTTEQLSLVRSASGGWSSVSITRPNASDFAGGSLFSGPDGNLRLVGIQYVANGGSVSDSRPVMVRIVGGTQLGDVFSDTLFSYPSFERCVAGSSDGGGLEWFAELVDHVPGRANLSATAIFSRVGTGWGHVWLPDNVVSPAGSVRLDESGVCHTLVIAQQTVSYYVGSPDSDGDGIPDDWEIAGVPIAFQSRAYLLPGARADHKDLYIEVDGMAKQSGGGSLVPGQTVLDVVADKFATAPVPDPDGLSGITLHIDRDEDMLSWEDWSTSDRWQKFFALRAAHFGKQSEQGDAALLAAKARTYRYCAFVHGLPGTKGGATFRPTGYRNAADFCVALGSWPQRPRWSDVQCGTFMHELGHALGLKHGGSDDLKFKPNYFSVMNYTWQMPSAVTVPASEQRAQQSYEDSWVLDYSRIALNTLDEMTLSEGGMGGDPAKVVPVGPPCGAQSLLPRLVHMGGDVDWNRNLQTDASPQCADANYLSTAPASEHVLNERLTGYADWPNLILKVPSGIGPSSPHTAAPLLAAVPSAAPTGATASPDDEMSAADADALSSMTFDCNGNGIPDGSDIASGTLHDADGNGIPDECERGGVTAVPSPPVRPSVLSLSVVGNPVGVHGDAQFELALPIQGQASLRVLDISGRVVATVSDEVLSAGRHLVSWNRVDARGAPVSAGVYFAELRVGGTSTRTKFIALR